MEQLWHFSHKHVLSFVQLQLQLDRNNENSDKEDDDDDKDDFVMEDRHVGICDMCEEEIYLFHQCYYKCNDCGYSLHKFCAQLPTTQENHPLHPGHNLTLYIDDQLYDSVVAFRSVWHCDICRTYYATRFYNYRCSICNFIMDIICATIYEQKMNHPSHLHQLQRHFSRMISCCNACGEEHSGTFYHCTTCSWFKIHLNCALLPSKLLIQEYTKESFSHPHALMLAYSFPYIELMTKFFPTCRVCDGGFNNNLWHYRCNKCRYYVHVNCATSKGDAFMSIIGPAGVGKTYKNFKDGDYPNLIRCPFLDESYNLVKHLFINKGRFIERKIDGQVFNHQHMLILFDTLFDKSISLHDPMRKVELLCDGCVRPITDVPFYKCSEHHCGFALHEWCTSLPSEIQNHHDHPEHTLFLTDSLGIFLCKICGLYSSGFAYGCIECEYYVDINCAFIPNLIIHDAHPNHLLQRFKCSPDISTTYYCKACEFSMTRGFGFDFHCPACDFYVHTKCALLLPKTIRHKYDKHPLSLRYNPAENHSSEYFCDICEVEFNPKRWFYHCSTCASSMHTACAPLILHCEQSTYSLYEDPIFMFINIKFGGTFDIKDHLHPVTFVQGIEADGLCIMCNEQLQYTTIFKCFGCKFALHTRCAKMLSLDPAIGDA